MITSSLNAICCRARNTNYSSSVDSIAEGSYLGNEVAAFHAGEIVSYWPLAVEQIAGCIEELVEERDRHIYILRVMNITKTVLFFVL